MATRNSLGRGFALSLVFGLICTLTIPLLMAQGGTVAGQSFAPDRLLVAFRPGTAVSDISAAHLQVGGRVVRSLNAIGAQVVAIPAGTVTAAMQQYARNPNVLFAEPNYRRILYRPSTTEGSEPSLGISNLFDEQWGLDNMGQSFGVTVDPLWGTLSAPAYTGVADADIDAPEGWAITQGSPAVKIAILDSGISCSHADLDSKCVEQVNFVADHGSTVDDILGHGTHVAAISAAETNNNVGTAGVAPMAKLGSLKVCYEDYTLEWLGIIQGVCEDADIAAGINYAADAGYQVISMSLAGPEYSNTLEAAVNYAWSKGAVIVGAAGNDYTTVHQYPAAFDNVIGVAATDYYDNLAYFSSFSTDSDDWVSVAAPGHVILSAVPGSFCYVADDDPQGCYDYKSGTSMAAPVVAGIAAVLWSQPGATNATVRSSIEEGADQTGALGQNFLAWTQHGRVNLHGALTHQPGGSGNDDTTPPVISNVDSTSLQGTLFEVSWTTDEPATSELIIVGVDTVTDNALVTQHSLRYRGKKGNLYQYYVSSTDAAGNNKVAGPFSHQN
jgi:thermitase